MTYHKGVERTTFHQCMYGLRASDGQGSAPAYKPTSVLTNHPALVEVLQTRCDGGHRQVQLIGKSACSQAAQYPPGLCTAMVKGIQVIRKSLDELTSAREAVLKESRQVSEGFGSVTGPDPSIDYLDACAEDLLYECELEDMCEEGPSTWENLAIRGGRNIPTPPTRPWIVRPERSWNLRKSKQDARRSLVS